MNRKLNGIDYVEEMEIGGKYLGYFTKIIPTTIMTVHIDQSIMEPSYYRHVVQGIEELDEGDQLEFHIASQGGRLDGLESVLSAIKNSMATSVAIINSECHSAASILALNCDAICVSPYASMLIHFVSFGSAGASNHVLKHAGHIKKTSERLFRDTYKYFLTEEEITRCIEDDYQLWLDSEEIQERLERKNALLLKEQKKLEVEAKKKSKPAKKSVVNKEDDWAEAMKQSDLTNTLQKEVNKLVDYPNDKEIEELLKGVTGGD